MNNSIVDYDEEDEININYQNTEELVRIFEKVEEALAKKISRFFNVVFIKNQYYYHDLIEIDGDRFEVIGNDIVLRRSWWNSCDSYMEYEDYKFPISALDNPEQYKAELEEKKRLEQELKAQKEAEEKQRKLIEQTEKEYKMWEKLNEKFGKRIITKLDVSQEFGDIGPDSNVTGVKIDNL